MKKSELASFIKEEIKSTLNTEGVWKKGHPSLIQNFLDELDMLKDKYYNIVGSDDVFNGLDQAEKAASELLTMAEATIETSPEDLAKVKKSADKDDVIKVTKEDATPKGEDFFYDYLDIGMSYLEGFGKKHSLDDSQLEKLGKKIVDQLYKGDVGKAYDAIVKRGAMNEASYSNQYVDKNRIASNKYKQANDYKASYDSIGQVSSEKQFDDDNIDKKAVKGAKKNKGLAKAAEELALLTREMKSLAKKYKEAEGEEKEKIVADLKKKTKLKKELEAIIDK